MLPGQYWTWRAWTQHALSPADLPWVLKANEHRGRGVSVMRQAQVGVVSTSPNQTKTNENERSTGRGVSCKRLYLWDVGRGVWVRGGVGVGARAWACGWGGEAGA